MLFFEVIFHTDWTVLALRVNSAYLPVRQKAMQKASLVRVYCHPPPFCTPRNPPRSEHTLLGRMRTRPQALLCPCPAPQRCAAHSSLWVAGLGETCNSWSLALPRDSERCKQLVPHRGWITYSQQTFSSWLNEVNEHLMPASMRVCSPLSNIGDDSVVAIKALLNFFFSSCFSILFFNLQQ